MKLLRRFAGWLRPKLPYLNIGLVLAAWWANDHVDQVFCRPVLWATWVLAVSTSAFLVWPWLRREPAWVQYPALFLQGVFLLVCIYCMWFFGWAAHLVGLAGVFAVFWQPAAPLVWMPAFFAAQVVRRFYRSELLEARLALGLGVVAPLSVVGWADYQFRQVEAAVMQLSPIQRQSIDALARVVPRSYVAERLAGTHFRYHNYFCVYDGIRPALHDPLVNICLWVRGGSDAMKPSVKWRVNPLLLTEEMSASQRALYMPAQMGTNYRYLAEQQAYVNRQATLYHRLFPARPLNAGCACTPGYGSITVQAK